MWRRRRANLWDCRIHRERECLQVGLRLLCQLDGLPVLPTELTKDCFRLQHPNFATGSTSSCKLMLVPAHIPEMTSNLIEMISNPKLTHTDLGSPSAWNVILLAQLTGCWPQRLTLNTWKYCIPEAVNSMLPRTSWYLLLKFSSKVELLSPHHRWNFLSFRR